MKVLHLLSAAAICASACGFAAADVTGSVKLNGTAPTMNPIDMSGAPACAAMHPDPVTEETVVVDDKNMLKNVVVYLKAADGQKVPDDAPKEPVVLDQKGCQYVPHVLAMCSGQDLLVRNSDDMLHNVHSLSEKAPFNFGQPTKNDGQKPDPMPKEPEAFQVKCEVHPWMQAWIVVTDNPYFAVSGDDGKFTIKTAGLPDGSYKFVAWQEKYGTAEQTVTVKDGKSEKPLDFTFNTDSKADAAAKDAGPKLAEAKAACCVGKIVKAD